MGGYAKDLHDGNYEKVLGTDLQLDREHLGSTTINPKSIVFGEKNHHINCGSNAREGEKHANDQQPVYHY